MIQLKPIALNYLHRLNISARLVGLSSFLIISLFCYSQTKPTDQIDSLNDLGYNLLYTNPDSSLLVADLAFWKSVNQDYSYGASYALNTKGKNYANFGSIDTALYYLNKCVFIDSVYKDEQGLLVDYADLASLYNATGDYPKSLTYHYKSLEIARRQNYDLYELQILHNIANVYKYTGDSLKAKNFYLDGIEIATKLNSDSQTLASFYNNIAELLLIYPGLIEDESDDIILDYLLKAKSLLESSEFEYRSAEVDMNLAQYYLADFNPEKAEIYAKNALIIFENLEFTVEIIQARNLIAEAYFFQEKIEDALVEIDSVIRMARTWETEHELVQALDLKTRILLKAGDFGEAMQTLNLKKEVNDSLLGNKTQLDITRIENEYQLKEEQNNVLELEAEINQHESRTITLWFWICICLVVIVSIVILIITLWKTKKVKRDLEISALQISLMTIQMNPNFTFNILNSIQNMILSRENDKASLHLAKFAGFLRKSLEYSSETYITVGQEISFIELYFELEQLRFKDRIHFNISVDDQIDLDANEVPPLFLLPFIENTIQHGFNGQQNGQLNIMFTAISANEMLITLSDNGIGLSEAAFQKIKSNVNSGINLSKKRLKKLNRDNDVEIKNNASKPGVVVKIKLFNPAGEK